MFALDQARAFKEVDEEEIKVSTQLDKKQGQDRQKAPEILSSKAITLDLKNLGFQVKAFHIVGEIAYLRNKYNELYETSIFSSWKNNEIMPETDVSKYQVIFQNEFHDILIEYDNSFMIYDVSSKKIKNGGVFNRNSLKGIVRMDDYRCNSIRECKIATCHKDYNDY